jgi:hypothetical protein
LKNQTKKKRVGPLTENELSGGAAPVEHSFTLTPTRNASHAYNHLTHGKGHYDILMRPEKNL